VPEAKRDIRLVIFDMDGVLDRYDIDARLEKLAAATGKSAKAIYAAIWESGLEDESDSGRISATKYLEDCSERVGASISRALWIEARRAAMTPNRAVLSLAAALKAKTGIAVLTNNGFLVKETFGEIFPELIPLFGEGLHVAAEFGTKKPDPEVYRRLTARHGVDAREAMMIDDKPENVTGAQSAGLTAHRFESAEGLTEALKRLHLL
jgi:putative hydrolase of the HAD superfamily